MIPTEPGVYPGLPRREYDQIEAINISMLLNGRQTMAHLKYAMQNRDEQTDAMKVGSALHCAVLEPEFFNARYVAFTGARRQGKGWDDFENSNLDRTILTLPQMTDVLHMRDSLLKFTPMKRMLESKGNGEMTAVWRDVETGIICKGMIDRVCEWNGWQVLLDVKTCLEASRDAFSKTIGNYGYHARVAWYLDGMESILKSKNPMGRRFFFFLVEKQPPHLCNWFDAHDDNDALVNEGRKVYRRILNQYANSMKTGEWTGYPITDSPEQISLQKWDYE